MEISFYYVGKYCNILTYEMRKSNWEFVSASCGERCGKDLPPGMRSSGCNCGPNCETDSATCCDDYKDFCGEIEAYNYYLTSGHLIYFLVKACNLTDAR